MYMSKYHLMPTAESLRKQGRSIGEIAVILKISKDTASSWCSKFNLSEAEKATIDKNSHEKGMRGRLIGANANRVKKQQNILNAHVEAKKEIGTLNERDLLILSSALYWAEGARSSGRFQFVNSDPAMVKIMRRFLIDYVKVKPEDIRFNLQINDIHKPRVDKVIKFWKKFLYLNDEQIGKTSFVRTAHKKIYANHDIYFGIARLRVVKSTNLLYKMLGRIEAIKAEVA